MSQPYEVFGSQNLNDDDGPVIDSLFIETDAPPNLKDIGEPIDPPAKKEPAKITRLLSGDITADPAWDPWLLLPADANRQGIIIRVYSATAVATDGCRFSDERGNIRTSGKILHNGQTTFDNHTGPIYALLCGLAANGTASAPVMIEYWSVTE